jgi:hypothetical protein
VLLATVIVASLVVDGDHLRAEAGARMDESSVRETPRRVLMGRIVNLRTMRAEKTLSGTVPFEEATDATSDAGFLNDDHGRLEAYQLTTGDRLWTVEHQPACHQLVAAGGHVYASCADEIVSFDARNGNSSVIDRATRIFRLSLVGSRIAAWVNRGEIALFDTATNRRLARKVLPAIKRSTAGAFVARPSGPGVCLYGLDFSFEPHQWAFQVGCFDDELTAVWTRKVSFPLRPGTQDGELSDVVRQAGRDYIVFDDQLNPGQTPPPRGLVVKLSDGSTADRSDRLIAAIADARGQRISIPALKSGAIRPVRADQQEPLGRRHVLVASSGGRTYALVEDEPAHLLGIDATAGKPVFDVAVPLGRLGSSLEVVAGFLVVETSYSAHSRRRVEIRHPLTGQVLYRDER